MKKIGVLLLLLILLVGCGGVEGEMPTMQPAQPRPTFPPTWTPPPPTETVATVTPRPTESGEVEGGSEEVLPTYEFPIGAVPLVPERVYEGQVAPKRYQAYHYTHETEDPLLILLEPAAELDIKLVILEGHLDEETLADPFNLSMIDLDGGWAGATEGVLFRAEPGFDYTLVVAQLFEERGGYRLAMQPIYEGMPGLLWRDADSVSGEGSVTEHRMPVQAGQSLLLYLLPHVDGFDSIDLRLELVDPAGESQSWDDGGFDGMERILLNPTQDGEYLLRVSEVFGDSANYTLLLFEQP